MSEFIKKFRKRPIEIEAVQVTEESIGFICEDFAPGVCNHSPGNNILVETLEGNMIATEGDWIVKGIVGEFYPVRDDIFQKTYEEERVAVDGQYRFQEVNAGKVYYSSFSDGEIKPLPMSEPTDFEKFAAANPHRSRSDLWLDYCEQLEEKKDRMERFNKSIERDSENN